MERLYVRETSKALITRKKIPHQKKHNKRLFEKDMGKIFWKVKLVDLKF